MIFIYIFCFFLPYEADQVCKLTQHLQTSLYQPQFANLFKQNAAEKTGSVSHSSLFLQLVYTFKDIFIVYLMLLLKIGTGKLSWVSNSYNLKLI